MTGREIPATESNHMKKVEASKIQPKKKQFQEVFDTKGKPVAGLWQRNGRYYAQLTFKVGGYTKKKQLLLLDYLPPQQQSLIGARH